MIIVENKGKFIFCQDRAINDINPTITIGHTSLKVLDNTSARRDASNMQ